MLSQSQLAVGLAVLLLRECFTAAGFLAHQRGNAAAEPGHDVEEFVPEKAVAEARDDGEIEADFLDRAADRATARLTLEVLQGGHEEFRIVPAGGAGGSCCAFAWRWSGLPRCGWGGLWFRRGDVALDEVDVLAFGGAGEEDALQCGGAQDAAVQMGEDGGEVGCAEAGGDCIEVGRGGAMADGVDEVAAVVEEDPGSVQYDGDVVGEAGGRVILWRVGRCSGSTGFHGSVSNIVLDSEARTIFLNPVVGRKPSDGVKRDADTASRCGIADDVKPVNHFAAQILYRQHVVLVAPAMRVR
jgi:hypothetical protein